jgi:hypothetical protein
VCIAVNLVPASVAFAFSDGQLVGRPFTSHQKAVSNHRDDTAAAEAYMSDPAPKSWSSQVLWSQNVFMSVQGVISSRPKRR